MQCCRHSQESTVCSAEQRPAEFTWLLNGSEFDSRFQRVVSHIAPSRANNCERLPRTETIKSESSAPSVLSYLQDPVS